MNARNCRCPKCGRTCEPCGTLTVAETRHATVVYQCENDECAVPWIVEGEPIPAAYTWIIGPDGKPLDADPAGNPLRN